MTIRLAILSLFLLASTAMGQISYWSQQFQKQGNAQLAQQFFATNGAGIKFTYDGVHWVISATGGGGGTNVPPYAGTSTNWMGSNAMWALIVANFYPLAGNPSGFLTGNQPISLTGDVTGGPSATSIATSLKLTGTAGTYTKTTFDGQGRETSGASAVLASADFANQGTTSTLLHGNAAGNPSWSAVNLGTDTTGLLSYTNISGLTDTQTNAMLNSPRFASIVSNSVVIAAGATNILGWVTNLAGVDWTIVNSTVTNSMGYWSTNGPSLLYSFDGVTWNPGSGSLVTNVAVEIGFYSGSMASNPPTMQIPLPGYVTNVTAWQLTRPDLFGRTNSTYGIHMQASDPVYPQDVATMAYVNNLFTFTPWWTAQQDVQLNGFYINLSSTWQEATTVTTNTAAYHLRFLGQDMLTVNSPNPVSVLISSVTTTNSTNVVVKVATNGLPVAPWLKLSHYILPAQWNMLTNRPTITSTNYVWTFVRPYTDEGFLLAVVPSTNAPAIQVSGTLDLMPFSTVSTNMGALRIWNSNNAALYTRGTNGVDKLLLVWP